MKTLFLLFPIFAMSQVGISTTNLTNTLDVNGTTRVRSLTLGTVETTATGVLTTAPYTASCMGVVNNAGTLLKGFGATTTKINNTTYRITRLFVGLHLKSIVIICIILYLKSSNKTRLTSLGGKN